MVFASCYRGVTDEASMKELPSMEVETGETDLESLLFGF